MGTELERLGAPMDREVWAAGALMTHPEIVRQVHEEFARSGAEVHITNTFSTAPHIIKRTALQKSSRELNHIAVRMAREGLECAEPMQEVWLAGSVSTAVWSRDDKRLSVEELRASFTEQAESLAEAGCDLIALEMMLTHEFAIDLDFQPEIVEIVASTGLPVWLGISAKLDGSGVLRLYDDVDAPPTVLEKAVASVVSDSVDVVGVMHSEVSVVSPVLALLRRYWQGAVSVYPHSGEIVWPNWQHDTVISPQDFVSAALGWMDEGVDVIGGCCGIGPRHIALLRDSLHTRTKSS